MRRYNTVTQYIATQLILDLYERSAWRPEKRVFRRLWEQDSLDLEEEKKRSAEAAESNREEAIDEEDGMPPEKQRAGNEGGGKF